MESKDSQDIANLLGLINGNCDPADYIAQLDPFFSLTFCALCGDTAVAAKKVACGLERPVGTFLRVVLPKAVKFVLYSRQTIPSNLHIYQQFLQDSIRCVILAIPLDITETVACLDGLLGFDAFQKATQSNTKSEAFYFYTRFGKEESEKAQQLDESRVEARKSFPALVLNEFDGGYSLPSSAKSYYLPQNINYFGLVGGFYAIVDRIKPTIILESSFAPDDSPIPVQTAPLPSTDSELPTPHPNQSFQSQVVPELTTTTNPSVAQVLSLISPIAYIRFLLKESFARHFSGDFARFALLTTGRFRIATGSYFSVSFQYEY